MAVKYEKLGVRRGLSLGTRLGENTFAKTGSAGQGSSRKVKAGLVGIFMALHAPIKSRLREHILSFFINTTLQTGRNIQFWDFFSFLSFE